MEQVLERHTPVESVNEGRRPAYEEVAELAYSHWEARGGDEGSPEDSDWFWAERELKAARDRAL